MKAIPLKDILARLLKTERFSTQRALAEYLGTSPRYLRFILSGQRSGAKYERKARAVYERLRRKEAPYRPPRKRLLPTPKRAVPDRYVKASDVVDVLIYVFQPADIRALPRREYQHTPTLFFTDEKRVRGRFDTWTGYSIVAAYLQEGADSGVLDSARMRKRRPRQEGMKRYRDRIAREFRGIFDRYEGLSAEQRRAIDHLPMDKYLGRIRAIMQSGGLGRPPEFVINFWASRFSERSRAGGPGKSRDPTDPRTRRIIEGVVEADISFATTEDMRFELVGLYGYSGFNKAKRRGRG